MKAKQDSKITVAGEIEDVVISLGEIGWNTTLYLKQNIDGIKHVIVINNPTMKPEPVIGQVVRSTSGKFIPEAEYLILHEPNNPCSIIQYYKVVPNAPKLQHDKTIAITVTECEKPAIADNPPIAGSHFPTSPSFMSQMYWYKADVVPVEDSFVIVATSTGTQFATYSAFTNTFFSVFGSMIKDEILGWSFIPFPPSKLRPQRNELHKNGLWEYPDVIAKNTRIEILAAFIEKIMKMRTEIKATISEAINSTDATIIVRPNQKNINGTLTAINSTTYTLKTESLDYPFTLDEVTSIEKYRHIFDFYVIYLRR